MDNEPLTEIGTRYIRTPPNTVPLMRIEPLTDIVTLKSIVPWCRSPQSRVGSRMVGCSLDASSGGWRLEWPELSAERSGRTTVSGSNKVNYIIRCQILLFPTLHPLLFFMSLYVLSIGRLPNKKCRNNYSTYILCKYCKWWATFATNSRRRGNT